MNPDMSMTWAWQEEGYGDPFDRERRPAHDWGDGYGHSYGSFMGEGGIGDEYSFSDGSCRGKI